MSVREHWINVRVNPEELARIREKQKELGIRNTGAYMRKMAMDGYCVNLDLSDVAQVSAAWEPICGKWLWMVTVSDWICRM